MAAAKGFAFALGKPLIGVSTLEAEARRFTGTNRPVTAVLRSDTIMPLPFSRKSVVPGKKVSANRR